MAKKGGVQQLQTDCGTDEEFEKLLDRDGLIVIDIYSEWCGPCLGMVGSLKKIKLELGGDNLHLAICKADGITALERFRNKSEPTWLFVTQKKAIGLMFGTNVPALMAMIAKELKLLNKEHVTYEITELQPEEVERLKVVQAAQAEAARIEREEAENKRRSYLLHVTNEIMENLPDIGVTIFGPQVNRDMFKKLMEPAETQKIQCKDRRVAMITPEEFETINFDCSNPLDKDVIAQLDKKELLICFWKISEEDKRRLEDIFQAYAHDLMTPTPFVDELGNVDPEKEYPPILTPMEVKVKPDIELPAEKEEEEPKKPDKPAPAEGDDIELPLDDVMVEEEEEEEVGEEENLEDLEAEQPPAEEEEEQDYTKIIMVPPIWVPQDRRTHASLIYVLFRTQTVNFLPPDPPPEPVHLILAFDAHKTRQIAPIMNKSPDDILHYGYFTSDNPEEAKLIANSIPNYQNVPKNVTDKLILKVAKKTSYTLLTLVTHGPSYVSPNTVVGKQEALKFFPEGYTTGDPNEVVEEDHGKKKKGKKGRKSAVDHDKGSKDPNQETASVTDLAEGSPTDETHAEDGEEGADGGEAPANEEDAPADAAPADAPPPE